jgi:hypothetical protein
MRLGGGWALLVMVLAAATPALAQPANADYRAGVRAARERRWEDARAAFERAHRTRPTPETSFNLAGAEAQTGRLRAAAAHYREFLERAPPSQEATIAAARQMISEIEARLARLRIVVTGAQAGEVVRIDGEAVPPTSEAVPIEAGAHRLTLERDGVVVAETQVQLAQGQAAEAALAAPAVAPIGIEPDHGAPDDGGGGGGDFPWLWVGIGAGAVVLVVVIVAVASSGGEAQPTQGTLGRVGVELATW